VIRLERDGDVWMLHMESGENRFAAPFVAALEDALSEVEKTDGPAALVTTGAGKFYSNGLDLDAMARDPDEAGALLARVLRLFGRILAFPGATVAAVNGHAFAGGAMLAVAHDVRVMRADRGYVCLPESDLGLPLQPGMTALLAARLPRRTAHEAIVTGRRYGGTDALAAGIVDHAVPEAEVLPRAVGIARALAGKHRPTLAALKRGLYGDALTLLDAGR
jgi:enoyl-CoA hydratase/carnithine racemase